MTNTDKLNPQALNKPGLKPAFLCPDIENALGTTDKCFLKYDYTFIRSKNGKKKTYQAKTEVFMKALSNPVKEKLPRIDCQAGTIQGVMADFDNFEEAKKLVPASFGKSWADIRRWFKCKYFNGCVFSSASGKAKIFFPISCPGLTTRKAENMLKKLLLGTDFDGIGKDDKNGMRYSFINTTSYPILSSWLKSIDFNIALEYNNRIIDSQLKEDGGGKDISITSSITYEWKSYIGEISENLLNDLHRRTKNTHIEALIRHMLGCKSCIEECRGIDLPISIVANSLKIDKRNISRIIDKAKELGIIKMVNNSIYGLKGRSFAFVGFWFNEAKRIISEQAQNRLALPGSSCAGLQTILERIQPGHWNKNLLPLTNFFQTENEFMACVEKIQGYKEKPERERQARYAWACHVKRDAHEFKKTEQTA